jgi:acetyl esterase/lipase
MKRVRYLAGLVVLASLFLSDASAGPFRNRGRQEADSTASAACDPQIPAISSGYGADGPYKPDIESVDNPAFREPVQVFFPAGAPGKRPVIFFSHGYGPGVWEVYKDLIQHMVSVGEVVVFSGYPMIRASNDERYDDLWQGFKAAADRYDDRMDLSRVGFVGHSFGGGATPAMAYKGLVQQGWGKQGAFLMELAPWYAFQITDAEMQQYPAGTLQLVEVYDKDDTNDHRMGIDLYKSTKLAADYYVMVHSGTVAGCSLTADHSTPGRNPSLRQKQYAVFRPFDMLADAAFSGSTGARQALTGFGTDGVYQPLSLVASPVPDQPESHYRNPWSDPKNQRVGH